MKKVAVTIQMDEKQKEMLRGVCREQYEYRFLDRETFTEASLSDCNIIIGNVPEKYLRNCRKLEWLQLDSAGANTYTVPGVMPKGAYLTNASGAYGLAISEHMIGTLLMLQKKLDRYYSNMKTHEWRDEGNVQSIWGSNTLVVGLGDIGSEFARKMNMLGSRVVGIRKHYSVKPDYVDEVYPMEHLRELLPKADIVAVTLPGTDENIGLFNSGMFELMKDTAYFLNVGRGSIVVTDDLTHALNDGIIAGAAVDVTYPEPLPQNNELWTAENLIITPHVSGKYHLPETLERILNIAVYNLTAYAEGSTLKNIVDFETGYRKFVDNMPASPFSRMPERPVILASASPRRKELLAKADIPFIIMPAQGKEISDAGDPVKRAEQLSKQKAEEVAKKMTNDPHYKDIEYTVLGADTVVYCDGEIMGKPADDKDAERCLKMIQGNTHSVVTGVTIARHHEDGNIDYDTFSERTEVKVYPMSDEQISEYIATGEPADKAGSYGIQGQFARFIESINGDYSNVVGLPIGHVFKKLKSYRTLERKS